MCVVSTAVRDRALSSTKTNWSPTAPRKAVHRIRESHLYSVLLSLYQQWRYGAVYARPTWCHPIQVCRYHKSGSISLMPQDDSVPQDLSRWKLVEDCFVRWIWTRYWREHGANPALSKTGVPDSKIDELFCETALGEHTPLVSGHKDPSQLTVYTRFVSIYSYI